MIKKFLKIFKKPKSLEDDFKGFVYPAPEPYDPFKEREHISSLDPISPTPELSKVYLEHLDNSTPDGEIPLSPELVKGINDIIQENYEWVWGCNTSREIEDLYEEFRAFHYNFSCLSMKSLPKERIDLLTKVYYAMQALKDEPNLTYKEYKALKNLLNELYKSSALRYYTPDIDYYSIRPFTRQDRVETLEEMLMEKWGKP
ncbi:MAG: hypothetical protein J6S85_06800 [Methanobrevibacter sp.]|nr:hypothetical protein [Methanobrevibacter sp.]